MVTPQAPETPFHAAFSLHERCSRLLRAQVNVGKLA